MDSRHFFDLVAHMREVQKGYFATRSSDLLKKSKELERQVDEEIVRVKMILKKKGEVE